MNQKQIPKNRWHNCRIGITGANGSLGRSLIKKLKSKGALVIGLTHGSIQQTNSRENDPHEWIQWNCGQEKSLEGTLESLDVLILNHGINPKGAQTTKDLNQAIEVNALSSWRLMECFESISKKTNNSSKPKEIWVNTSEAEIQPALSPGYEISKRLLGQLVSIKWNNLNREGKDSLIIRKLILGPFKSKLNTLGVMSPDTVASQIIKQVEFKFTLVIVTPNPFTYILVPINEILRAIYYRLFNS